VRVLFFVRYVFRRFPLLLIANTLLLVLAGMTDAVSLLTLAPIADLLINPDLQEASPVTLQVVTVMTSVGVPATLWSLLAAFLGLNLLKNGFQILATHFVLRIKYAVLRGLVVGTFEEFFNARWYFFSSGRQGNLLNTFTRETNVVGDAFAGMGRLFAGVVQVILYLLVPFYLSWQVTSVSLATALLLAGPFVLLGRVSYRLGQRNTSTANQVTSIIQESLGSAKVILGFANQHKSAEALSHAFEAHRRATLKSQTLGIAMPLVYQPLGLLVLIAALFVSQMIAFPLSELAVVIYALYRIVPVVGRLTGEKNLMDNSFPAYEQVMHLTQRAQGLRQPTGTRAFTGITDRIATEGLSFAHPDHEPALVDINVCIPQGEMIAFVGESGAGKSTLIDVIMGLQEPLAGQITIDGVPLSDFDIYSYRRRIGYVPQDSVLFNMTIKDNLLWANEAATEQEIKRACQQANADQFIEEFPKGYNTLVGDRGVRLSGGQAQRIALARAILRKPDLLILDEATSSLDTRAERLIQQAIENVARETTVVVIAHRLSTIINADYIYVLRDGRVVEEGTYSKLVRMDGYFNRMAQSQVLKSAQ